MIKNPKQLPVWSVILIVLILTGGVAHCVDSAAGRQLAMPCVNITPQDEVLVEPGPTGTRL